LVNATKTFAVMLGFAALSGCQSASSESRSSIDAAALVREYESATAEIRRRYDGKEIVVRGYAATSATMPGAGADQGSIRLREGERSSPLTCWFSHEQIREFAKIKGTQHVVVKGVFNGEAGADLKFCKLIKIE
jgi:hypothetical protein